MNRLLVAKKAISPKIQRFTRYFSFHQLGLHKFSLEERFWKLQSWKKYLTCLMLRNILILVLDEITQKYIRYLFLISVDTVSIILRFCKQLLLIICLSSLFLKSNQVKVGLSLKQIFETPPTITGDPRITVQAQNLDWTLRLL